MPAQNEKGPLPRAGLSERNEEDLIKNLPQSSGLPTERQFRFASRRTRRALRHLDLTFYESKVANFILDYSYDCGRLHAIVPKHDFFCKDLGMDKSDVWRSLDTLENKYSLVSSRDGFYAFLPKEQWRAPVLVHETRDLLDMGAWLENPSVPQSELFAVETVQNDAGFTEAMQLTAVENSVPGSVGESPTNGNGQFETEVGDSPTRVVRSPSAVGHSAAPVGESPTKPVALKGSLKVPDSKLEALRSAKSQASGRPRERDFMERLEKALGHDVYENDGGKWRVRFRERPGKCLRCLAELELHKREGKVFTIGPGAKMEHDWKTFSD